MSQQSNPATLREAADKLADFLFKSVLPGHNYECDRTGKFYDCECGLRFDHHKKAEAHVREVRVNAIVAALEASGTEAAPRTIDEDAWITQKATEEDGAFVSAGCIMPAAQAAASPEAAPIGELEKRRQYQATHARIQGGDDFDQDEEPKAAASPEGEGRRPFVRHECGCEQNGEVIKPCDRHLEFWQAALRQSTAPPGGRETHNELEIVKRVLAWHQTGYALFHNTEGHGVHESHNMAIGWASVELAKWLAQESKTGAVTETK